MAGFARPRDCPKAPCPPARLRIVGIHEAAHARLAAANAHHHFAANGERRHGHAIARLVVGHLCGPPFLPALDVESHQLAIERGAVQLVVQDRLAHGSRVRIQWIGNPPVWAASRSTVCGQSWCRARQPSSVQSRTSRRRREAMPLVIARVSQPIAGLAVGIENSLIRHLRRQRGCEKQERARSHDFPRRLARYATRSVSSSLARERA